MNSIFFAAIVFTIILGFTALFFYLKRELSAQKTKDDTQSLLLLQNNINEIARVLDARLSESARLAQSSGQSQNEIIRSVSEKLAQINEATKHLQESNKQVLNFSDQIRKLEDILKNPKQRGILGEYFLETLLKNAFSPNQYQMQYKFADGEIVDAVIFMGDKLIPIDSKFSLENYNRIVEEPDQVRREELEKAFKQDLKNRIDETAKYVRPNEKTTEFALMFIPAEGIYYDLLVNKVGAIKVNTRDLLDYAAHDKKVHIVSPTTFYVMLQTLWQGMRAYQIQESTEKIRKNIEQLGRHLKAYNDYFSKLGNNLSTTVNSFNSANKEFGKIEKDILRIGGEAIDADAVPILDRPQSEE